LYFNVSIISRELQTSRLEILTSRSRLGWWSQRLGLVSVSGGKRLGLFSVSSCYVSCPCLPPTKSSKAHPTKHIIGHIGDESYGSKDPTSSVKALKED